MKHLALVGLLALTGIAGILAWTPEARPTPMVSLRGACPRALPLRQPERPYSLVRALPREIPRAYHDLASMGHVAWHHYTVAGVLNLNESFYPDPKLAAYYRKVAARRCGRTVATRSWAVMIGFPECQLPCSEVVAFAARTRSGWRIWGDFVPF